MKSLTKKALAFVFAIAIVFCGIGLLTNLSKQSEIEPSFSSLNAPTGSYSTTGTNSWQNAANRGTSYASGGGTVENPYEIANAKQLAYMASRINGGNDNAAFFKLTDDIDLSDFYWVPIGSSSTNYQFKGNFNGNNKKITGMYIGIPSTQSASLTYAGLFGYVNGGKIENLNLECFMQVAGVSTNYIGGIVGYGNNLTLEKCTVISGSKINSALTGSAQIGGLVGGNTGTISFNKCFNNGAITTTGTGYTCRTGGLIANANSATIKESGNLGAITATSAYAAGGVVAYSSGNRLVMDYCFNKGALDITNIPGSWGDTGGLIGYASSSYTITNCYNSGSIQINKYISNPPSNPPSTGYGGLVGWGGGTIESSYVSGDITINNTLTVVGIFVGSGSPVLKNCYYADEATFIYNGGNDPLTATGGGNGSTVESLPIDEIIGELGWHWEDVDGVPTLIKESQESAVTFYYNYLGANPDSKVITKAFGRDLNIEASDIAIPTRIGYIFTKWTENPNGSNSSWYEYDNGNFVFNNGVTKSGPVKIDSLKGAKLYARWTPIDYVLEIENTVNTNVDTYTVSMEDKDYTISADAISSGFMFWQISNNQQTLVRENGLDGTLKLAELFDESFIEAHAYNDSGTMKIKLKAIFVNPSKKIHTVTVVSNQQSFGDVKLDGGSVNYGDANRYEEGSNINVTAIAEDYYKFSKFIIGDNDYSNENYTITEINADITINVIFEKVKYGVLISSRYQSGDIISSSVGLEGLSNNEIKIGDKIQVTYKTNVPGYVFAGLKYETSGDDVLEVTGFGIFSLVITEDVLKHLDPDGKLRLVVEYTEQYLFYIDFADSDMFDYCAILIDNNIRVGGIYYLNKDTNVVIQFTLNKGYIISSTSGLTDSEFQDLLNGELTLSISQDWNIIINIAPKKYNISLSAKWVEGDKAIDEIDFSLGNNFAVEYKGETNSIERIDVQKYKFVGWLIYHPSSDKWVPIDINYVKANGLNPLRYSYLESSGFINDLDEIKIIASYVPVYTLTISQGAKIEIKESGSDFKEVSFNSSQYSHGTQIRITVKHSDYIAFSGFKVNGELKNITKSDGFYVLTFNLSEDSIVAFDFESITKTFNVVKVLNEANGVLDLNTSGAISGNDVKVKLNDTINIKFNVKSGYVLKGFTVNGLTKEQIVEKNYATYSDNILRLNLNEDTLKWLEKEGLNIKIDTVFNPLITGGIIGGGVLILALMIFIIIYIVAARKKKIKIQAAIKEGIIGAARFKTNFHENID